jgi:hypothetical protein
MLCSIVLNRIRASLIKLPEHVYLYIEIVLVIIRGEVEHEMAKVERVETLLPAAYKYIQRYQKEPRTVCS